MRELPQCHRCQFYADSSFLLCALHPLGIFEENNCSDFHTANEIFYQENKFESEDLGLAEGLLLDQGSGNSDLAPSSNSSTTNVLAHLLLG